MWLASIRPTGRPHLVPLWFVWAGGCIYLCVMGSSVKVRNIVANPAVSLALESGAAPVVIEGHASLVATPWPEEAVRGFQQKYDWTISTDTEYDVLVAVTPQRWLMVQQ
ncbi:MAG: pyridoxamine 5'-phosphate oxidase [Nostocaceae cyanobacterium CSU_2_110]|nr:pyridoxamine 5'-phosphate oxidase [Nostocaceae cyanobacterium CSU_2_110]